MNDAQHTLYAKCAAILRDNLPYHFCHGCQRITDLESDDAHGQCCVHCGSHRVSYHEKREVEYAD